MGVLVGPFFLLFALVTGNSTGHGACTSRRAATSLSGSKAVVFTAPRLQSLTVSDQRRFSGHLQGFVFTVFMADDDEFAKYGFEPAADSGSAVLESSATTASTFLGESSSPTSSFSPPAAPTAASLATPNAWGGAPGPGGDDALGYSPAPSTRSREEEGSGEWLRSLSAGGGGKRQHVEEAEERLPLMRGSSDLLRGDDSWAPFYGTDSESSDSDSGLDTRTFTPELVSDDEFESVYAEAGNASSQRAARLEQAAVARADEERSLLDVQACRAAADFQCSCFVSCSLRAQATPALVQGLRRGTLRDSLYSGSRTVSLARAIEATKTATATCMHETNPRKKADGSLVPKSQMHYIVNGMDVCFDFYCKAKGVTANQVKIASTMARSGNMQLPRRKTSRIVASGSMPANADPEDPYAVTVAVQWVLQHVTDSGAELIPNANFAWRSTADDQLARATTSQVAQALQNTCQARLHEREVKDLYRKYEESSRGLPISAAGTESSSSVIGGYRFDLLSYDRFSKVFRKHKQLKHVVVARDTDSFAKCSTCFEHCSIITKTAEANRTARAVAIQNRKLHLQEQAENRDAYVRRTLGPQCDYSAMVISRSISVVIDKPTKQSTQLPAMAQLPKFLTSRFSCPVLGAIAHGVGSFAATIPAAQSDGVNATCEMLYLVMCEIQKAFTTPRKLDVQGDNHTDNKTPAFILFLAWLIFTGVVDEATFNLLTPGHGHVDLDQLFSKWIRSIIDQYNRSVTRSRLMDSIRSSRRRSTAATTEVTMHGVRDWAGFLRPFMADVDLHRIAMSSNSGEGIYQFILKKGPGDTVLLFYKRRSVDNEVYPRPHQLGESISIGEKTFIIVDTKFDPVSQLWNFTAESEDDLAYNFSLPPVGIIIFGGESGKPEGMPVYEGMQAGHEASFAKAKRSLVRCFTDLSAIRDTPGAIEEWEEYFHDEETRIALCKEDSGPYYRGPAPPPLRAGVADVESAMALPPARAPFAIDPVVFKPVGGSRGLADADRAAFASSAARRAQRGLADGRLVALSLRLGTQYPPSHVVPFCLGLVPSGYRDVPLPSFPAFFSEARSGGSALSGTWLAADGPAVHLAAPLSAVICSGLELEPLAGTVVPLEMSVEALKAELKCRGQPYTGNKAALTSRLAASVAGAVGAVPLCRARRLTKESVTQLRDVAGDYNLGL